MHLLLNRYNRILYYNGAVYSEYSDEMRSWSWGTMLAKFISGVDYLYIGTDHTFSSRFFHVGVVNSVTSALSVEYFIGKNTWSSVRNLRNETSVAGVPFARSGFITWDLPKDWMKTQINNVPDLEPNETSADGKGLFWIRIKSSVSLSVTTSLKWIGLLWTSQDYMKVKWPEVDSPAYLPTGKTDWYELIEMSTGDVFDDLNLNNVLNYELQAKDIDEMAKLTALKTMINILIPMTHSETLMKMKADFEADYTKLLRKRISSIDQNEDEVLSNEEKQPLSNSRLFRV